METLLEPNSTEEVNGGDAILAGSAARTQPLRKSSSPIKTYNEDLQRRLADYRNARSLTLDTLAFELGVGVTRVTKYLSGKPDGDVAKLEAAAQDVLRTAAWRDETRMALFPTNVTRRVSAICELIRKTGDTGLVHGPSGCGKSTGVEMYRVQNPSALAITANRWQFTPLGLQELLWSQMETSSWPGNVRKIVWMIERLRGSNRLIILDNAQRLQNAGREWIFDFHEATGCPVAMIGHSKILEDIRRDDQQFSRFGIAKAVKLEGTEKAAAEMLARFGANMEAVLPLALQVANGRGHLRALHKQLVLTRELMGSGGKLSDPAEAFQAAHTQLIRDYDLLVEEAD